MSQSQQRALADLVFVGINRKVAALDCCSGEIVWQWQAPKGSGFVALLLDGDRLIVGVNGYVYCLDPLYGQQVWQNPLKGFGGGSDRPAWGWPIWLRAGWTCTSVPGATPGTSPAASCW